MKWILKIKRVQYITNVVLRLNVPLIVFLASLARK